METNTLGKGIKILEVIAGSSDSNGIPLSCIAQSLGINKSNVYRYITTLVNVGWVERDEASHCYRIGSKLLQTASLSLNQFDLISRAKPYLQKLSKETKHTVHLASLHPPFIIYLQKIEYEPQPMMQSSLGKSSPCYSTAVGKAMLATMNDQQIRNMLPTRLESYGPCTLSTIDDLLHNLAKARRAGFAYELEENEVGVGCVGAPVYSFDGRMIAGVSVSGPIGSMTNDRIQVFGERVIETAKSISLAMGYCLRKKNGDN
jgi:IclR family transcriptional regulator, KDG regulon repressor